MQVMTSRQRVERAVNFQSPDRVPVDLGGIRASGISVIPYAKLKERMGLKTPHKIHDSMQLLAELEPEVLERLHVDVVPLEAMTADWAAAPAETGVQKQLFSGLPVCFPPGTDIAVEPEGSWVMRNRAGTPYARIPKDGHYFDFIRPTMAGLTIDPKKFKPRREIPEEELERLGRRARFLYDHTDKAILGWGASISMMGLSALLSDNITQGALDEWLCMLMTDKETAHDMMGRYTDAVIECLRQTHQAVGDRCFAWGVASDDAGTQKGELIAPDLFAEMVIPHYRRLCAWVHANTKWKTYLHSCGSVYHYIPLWIKAGIDILNPVQISAANMEPERLMRDFGGKIVFWGGGCDTQRVLPKGTPSEVREHVKKNLDAFAWQKGGFVFTQVHNIQPNVPVENIEAMFDAVWQYGGGR